MKRVDPVDERCYWFVGDHGSHSTVTYHKVAEECSTVQYSAVQCSAVQYSAVQYSTVQYSTEQYQLPVYCDPSE